MIWHWTRALVSNVAVVHHRVQMGISQNHVSRGSLPPSPIIWSMSGGEKLRGSSCVGHLSALAVAGAFQVGSRPEMYVPTKRSQGPVRLEEKEVGLVVKCQVASRADKLVPGTEDAI